MPRHGYLTLGSISGGAFYWCLFHPALLHSCKICHHENVITVIWSLLTLQFTDIPEVFCLLTYDKLIHLANLTLLQLLGLKFDMIRFWNDKAWFWSKICSKLCTANCYIKSYNKTIKSKIKWKKLWKIEGINFINSSHVWMVWLPV